MNLTPDTLHFIRQHRQEDVRSLALQARKYPAVDMPVAITQIAGWQVAKEKVPAWANLEEILYPVHLSMEQCSSEVTARYKAEIIRKTRAGKNFGFEEQTGKNSGFEEQAGIIEQSEAIERTGTFTDLTGGFGIDCAFLSAGFEQATYVERQAALCEIASHNFPLLGLGQISVCNADSVQHLQAMPAVEWIFIDPARRDGHGGKTIAIGDCEPNVAALEELLLEKAEHVLIKLSPMLDLTLAISDLKHVREAHIVSVGNECKELLLVLGRNENPVTEDIPIHCVNLSSVQDAQSLVFTRQEEKESACKYTATLKSYLYEPNASILKGGAFRSLCAIYKVEKLHANSHLYTSDEYVADFPGRRFRITGSCGFSKNEVKEVLGAEKKANLTVRNFPASVAELRKRLKLAEGGSVYLFATTLANEKRVLISCRA